MLGLKLNHVSKGALEEAAEPPEWSQSSEMTKNVNVLMFHEINQAT